jgi:hypothetical protein
MGETGCLKDIKCQNLEGEHISTGSTGTYEGNHADFISGYLGNLTGAGLAGITDAEEQAGLAAIGVAGGAAAAARLAVTLVANAVNFMNSAHTAAGAFHLPEATKGTHLALKYTQSPDGAAGAHACHTEGGTGVTDGAVFALQVVGDLNGGVAGSAIVTAGTNVAPTTKIINYIPEVAVTNGLGTGSIVQFFCPKDGQWLVRYHMAPLGTGATGAFTVA